MRVLASTIGLMLSLIGPAASAQDAGQAQVLSAVVKPGGITFRVPSHGCTRKANFGVETLAQRPLTILLVRLAADPCEGHLPQGTTVTFSFAELGQQRPLSAAALRSIVIVNER